MPKRKPSKPPSAPKVKRTRSPKKVPHYAEVVRLRVERAVIKFDHVEDPDLTDAIAKAGKLAKNLPDDAWVPEYFDPSLYVPIVTDVTTESDVAEFLEPGEQFDPEIALEGLDRTRFMILSADIESGEGEIALQPWFVVDRPSLIMADICRDWVWDLEKLGIIHLADRLDAMIKGAPVKPSDRILFASRMVSGPKPKPEPKTKPKK
ncbi:MAG: hypothetical protein ABL907_18395 [Hyphomicrobium sp.]